FKLNGVKARWFHELETDNPLFDIQYMKTRRIDDVEGYIERTLSKWSALVREIESKEMVYVIDSYLLQSTIGHLFDSNANENQILDLASKVPPIIAPLCPVIIYFNPADTKKALYGLEDKRGKEWIKQRSENQKSCPYAIENNLQGFDGWVTMLSRRAELSDRILASYPFPKLIIDPTEGEWDLYYKQILEFVDIDFIPEQKMSIEFLEQFQGVYQILDSDFTCSIKLINESLFILGFLHKEFRLIFAEENTFEVEGTPYTIHFHQSADGDILRMTFDGSKVDEADICTLERLST
ncbi:MAG: hypothetical protein ACFE7R_04620, partial [Candidatus Hodarchaeota archaeon]